jgi:phenylalanyl-tRNA synthetase beta chain
MGYDYSAGKVSIPAWRTDILHEVDIAEDIAIAYGYENLIPEIPEVSTVGQESKESKLKSKIAEMLAGLGLIEISSFHLIKEDEAEKAGVEEKIELENSKTEYKYLRQDLVTPMLRIFAENKDNEYPQKIFEIGAVFSLDNRVKMETGIIESENLVIASSPGSFTEIKQVFDYLIKMLGLEYKIEESSKKGMIEGRTGSIVLNGKKIGYLGEVHPDTLHNWNIKMPIALIEISLEELMNLI